MRLDEIGAQRRLDQRQRHVGRKTRRVGEHERLARGLQHQPCDVLADVRQRLVLAGRRPELPVEVGHQVPAHRRGRGAEHLVGDHGRVPDVVAADGDRPAVVDARLPVDDQPEAGRQSQGDPRPSGAGDRRRRRRPGVAGRDGIKPAHQPTADAVAAERAVALGDARVEVDVDCHRPARRQRRRQCHPRERPAPHQRNVVERDHGGRAVDAQVRDFDRARREAARIHPVEVDVVERGRALAERVRVQPQGHRRHRVRTVVDDAQARVAGDAPPARVERHVQLCRRPVRRRPRDRHGGRIVRPRRPGPGRRRQPDGERERNRSGAGQGPGSGPRPGVAIAVDVAASPTPGSSP